MTQRSVSFVCPAYNERESLPELIRELHVVGKSLGVPYEILIVDDGSTDGTSTYLKDTAGNDRTVHAVILRQNSGKATALYAGFQRARGERIVTLDADLQNDPGEVPKLLAAMAEQNVDIVTGWKFDRPDSLEKRLPSKFFNFVTRRLSGLPIHDFNSGIKLYTREAAQALELYGELHRYIPILAASQGYRTAEVQTHTRERKYGETKYRGKRYFRGFFDLLTVFFLTKYNRRPLHLFGGIGLSIGGIGTVLLVYLALVKLIGHQAIGTRPMLTFAIFFTLVGLQLVVTGLLAELLVRGMTHRQPPIRSEWNGDGPLT
jgi:glycosyltransferase involved in cell wall biosynthesis